MRKRRWNQSVHTLKNYRLLSSARSHQALSGQKCIARIKESCPKGECCCPGSRDLSRFASSHWGKQRFLFIWASESSTPSMIALESRSFYIREHWASGRTLIISDREVTLTHIVRVGIIISSRGTFFYIRSRRLMLHLQETFMLSRGCYVLATMISHKSRYIRGRTRSSLKSMPRACLQPCSRPVITILPRCGRMFNCSVYRSAAFGRKNVRRSSYFFVTRPCSFLKDFEYDRRI